MANKVMYRGSGIAYVKITSAIAHKVAFDKVLGIPANSSSKEKALYLWEILFTEYSKMYPEMTDLKLEIEAMVFLP